MNSPLQLLNIASMKPPWPFAILQTFEQCCCMPSYETSNTAPLWVCRKLYISKLFPLLGFMGTIEIETQIPWFFTFGFDQNLRVPTHFAFTFC